jgi:hypothetical protein
MVTEYQADALRFEEGDAVAAGDQRLGAPTRAVRTGSGFWGLFAAGDDVVVVRPGGAVQGPAGEVRSGLERLIAGGGLDEEDVEAASSFLPFLGGDDPGAAEAVPRSRVAQGPPPTYWLSGTMNSPPGGAPETTVEEAQPGPDPA